jgi:hypothetical protein
MRNLVIAVGVAAVVMMPVYAQNTPEVIAQATQHSMNQSGAQGRIEFRSSPGGGLAVTGTATGLQPSVGRYVSLVYDRGSVPGGPEACEPTTPMAGMFVGIWAVDALGEGTLIQLAPPAAIAPLEAIDTISIRDTTINGGRGVEAVVACGEIAVFGGR